MKKRVRCCRRDTKIAGEVLHPRVCPVKLLHRTSRAVDVPPGTSEDGQRSFDGVTVFVGLVQMLTENRRILPEKR